MEKNQLGKSYINGLNIKKIMEELHKILDYDLVNSPDVKFTLLHLLILVGVLFLTSFSLKIYRKIITRHLSDDDKQKFVSVFQFAKFMIYFLVIIITLHASGINMSMFVTYAAAIFVGLGLALQTFLQDIVSGIYLILDKSLHVGDIIEVDGKVGKVTNIRVRSTIMVTRNDKVMVIPNHKFMNEVLMNWTQNSFSTRENVTLGVGYSSDIRLVEKLLIECVTTTDGILTNEKIQVYFEDFGDSTLVFSVYFYVDNAMITNKIQSDIRFKIDDAFRANNIENPFPQRVVKILNNKTDA